MQTLKADLTGKIQPPLRNEVPAGAEVDGADLAGPGFKAMNFVPPYSCINRGFGADSPSLEEAEKVTVSRQLLEFLLRCVLVHVEFDEEQYQTCNPDVAAAIRWSTIKSGREHFVTAGYFEGRSGGVCVDEAWYLVRNPDVAAARAAGKFESAAAQYRLTGASEWRAPNPRLEEDVDRWKSILDR
jgi:hypothetical protein